MNSVTSYQQTARGSVLVVAVAIDLRSRRHVETIR